MEDDGLVLQFQAGKHQSFDILVERHKNRLYYFALRLVNDHQEAEDLLQETLIRAYRALDRFRLESSFSSWLFTIMINHFRSTSRKKRLKIVMGNALEHITDKKRDQKIMDGNEMQEMARQAIEQLPPKQKLVLNLKVYEQMSYREISQIMEMSVESVKANLSYARKNLRKRLGDKI